MKTLTLNITDMSGRVATGYGETVPIYDGDNVNEMINDYIDFQIRNGYMEEMDGEYFMGSTRVKISHGIKEVI